MSYHQDRTSVSGGGGDVDNSMDPSAGGLFTVDFKKHEDLKNMLDSNKDGLKLDAMKRIIGMVAKGKNASHLFPAVVKNVASKNIEVKKLVYVYLERYAEEQQDLALLSISTFQRGLKDHNQLIRGSALRVLSSIRVPIIVPIMMLAIKDGVTDMSPFVRKTAAHAIPKLYSLDPDQKDNLIEVLERLLNDRTTLVAGSVVMAFQELCPERIDLVHKHYRKLCSLLVDVDEWGQIAILNMLTRYARTQFLDPNKYDTGEEENKPFYEESESEDSEPEKPQAPKYVMDPDHRLLLKCAKPLLQSRNAAVVMTVAQLFYHVAPRKEVTVVAKALVRLLRSYREVQAVVLQNIASMSLTSKSAFSPYLKSFYVRSTDPTHIRILKLEILTNLATETSISTILREFQTYVRSSDKQFVAHTIQAIGRCAANIPEVTDTCLAGLVGLLSNRDELVVAESIVVIKKLLQMNPSQHKEIIKHMGKLFVTIQVAMAKASILWLIGEYTEQVPRIAPDVLRQAAKNFINEDDIVKLQIVNLAAKLFVTNHKQSKLLTQYVLQLAKYDQNYDIRDRARFIRHLIMPTNENDGILHKHAKKILLAPKPAPVLESPFKDRERYQLGTLSHSLNTEANGYQKLPDFPEEQPDPNVRNVVVPEAERMTSSKSRKKPSKPRAFYSDDESDTSSGSESSEGESGSSSSGTEDSESDSDSDGSTSTGGPDSRISDSDKLNDKTPVVKRAAVVLSSSDENSTSGSDSSKSDSDSSSSEDSQPAPPKSKTVAASKKKPKDAGISLLDLDDFNMPPPTMNTSQPATILSPMLTSDLQGLSINENNTFQTNMSSNPYFDGGKKHELLHRVTGDGLSATYRYTRSPCIYGEKMVTIELEFTNNSDKPIKDIHIGEKKLQGGLKVQDFSKIDILHPGLSTTTTFGVDFCDTMQPLAFELCTSNRQFKVSVKVPIGELMRPITMSEDQFIKHQKKMSGMNENSEKILIADDETRMDRGICKSVVAVANLGRVPSLTQDMYRFAGRTASTQEIILLEINVSGASSSVPAKVKVNCEKIVIGSLIMKKMKEAFSS